MRNKFFSSFILAVTLAMALPWGAQAAVVGQITAVEGSVDLLKAGKAPGAAAKLQDAVEPGDVIRTKTLSRAQITFIDDTIMKVGPESRLAIEEFMYDAAKGQRKAVIQVFRGLVHTLVTRLIKLEEPDFLLKTHTSILGVRGTSWYTSLKPLKTDVYIEKGKVSGRNILTEVKGEVVGTDLTHFSVGQGQPPTTPMPITPEDLNTIKGRLSFKGGGGKSGPGGIGSISVVTWSPPLIIITTPVKKAVQTVSDTITDTSITQPVIPPQPPVIPTTTYTFVYEFTGGTYTLTSTGPDFSTGNIVSTGTSIGTQTGLNPGSYAATYNFSTKFDQGGQWPESFDGTFDAATMTGQVSGPKGGTLKGTMVLILSDGNAGVFKGTVPVTIDPSGKVTANLQNVQGVAFDGSGSIPVTITQGTFVETPYTVTAPTRLQASKITAFRLVQAANLTPRTFLQIRRR
jgi:hypothetical protein